MNGHTKIIIADDHPLFRGGLRQVIEDEQSYAIIGEASDGKTALELICGLKPDVAVLDLNMPELNGFELIQELKRINVTCRIVMLTMHNEEAMFSRAMSLGVLGYVLKDGAAADIVKCLNAVCRGRNFVSEELRHFLIKRANGNVRPVAGIGALTPTERTVLQLIAEYKTSKEIADDLGISHRTVENHRNNISGKLDVRGSHALIKFALHHRDDL